MATIRAADRIGRFHLDVDYAGAGVEAAEKWQGASAEQLRARPAVELRLPACCRRIHTGVTCVCHVQAHRQRGRRQELRNEGGDDRFARLSRGDQTNSWRLRPSASAPPPWAFAGGDDERGGYLEVIQGLASTPISGQAALRSTHLKRMAPPDSLQGTDPDRACA